MAIDNVKYHAPATKGDVARVAIQASLVAFHTRLALKLAVANTDADLTFHLNELATASQKLDEAFDELTGYTADA